MPAIEHIKNNMAIIHLNSAIDYRRVESHTHKRYLTPLNARTDNEMRILFEEITAHEPISTEPWEICGRRIPVIAATKDCVWFDFYVLCAPPRSQLDYIAISQKIKHLFLSDVPILSDDKISRDQATYLTHLIDVLYDERIQLTLSAQAPIDELYPKGELTKPFERTRSRIIEICS
jgi:cell division protein ZapE